MIYDRIEDIPYDVLRRGGRFQVRQLPSEMSSPGKCMGAIPQQGGTTLQSPGDGEDPRFWWWILLLIPWKIILYTFCTVVVFVAAGHLVHEIRAPPEGRIVNKFSDGSVLYETPAGGTLLIGAEGDLIDETDPPSDFKGILTAATVLIIVAVLVFVFVKVGLPMLQKRSSAESTGG